MKKIFYLPQCGTCKRILSEINPGKEFILRDIKSESISGEEVDEMAKIAGSYEAIFSKIAMKYRALKLNERVLSESDYRHYIMQEYTFLKRPVIIDQNRIFVGSSKSTIASLKASYPKK